MDEKQKPLSAAEIKQLRDELASVERHRWLRRLIRTAVVWTVGAATAALALVDGVVKAVDWMTRK